MASAIWVVRIVPEAPTIMPATISATLSSAMPAAAADRPVNALSSEITTGMSAPPIGSTNMLPSSAAAIRMPTKSHSSVLPATIMPEKTRQVRSSARLISCCSGSWIGRPGRISCSLPKAMFEPQKETDPMIAENSIGISVSRGRSPPAWRNSAHAISATAPPPTPLKSATICGIAVIFTLRAAGTPTAVPMTRPITIKPQWPMKG